MKHLCTLSCTRKNRKREGAPLFRNAKAFITHHSWFITYLFALIWGMVSSCGPSDDKLIPVKLQCEYQTEPIGIDVPAPRFGWQLFDAKRVRGQAQTAYHVLVASSLDKLTEAGADIWNSGKTASPQSVLVPFEGKELQSSCAYFWKVRIYDKDGLPSEWSHPARFVTGILDPGAWDEAA
jgi:alpha-L-rhamnosidase